MQAVDVRAGMFKTVPVTGGALTVQTVGAGRPLLMIHGWTLDHRAWAPQVELLGDRFEMVTYDRRGCGTSTAPSDLALEVDDVERIMDGVGIARADIVALSQGCRIALSFGLHRPERVSSLTLAGGPLPYRPAHDRAEGMPIEELTSLAVSESLGELRHLLRSLPFMRLGIGADTRLLDAMIQSYRGRDLLEPTGALTLSKADLASMDVPTLLLVGEQDSIARREAAAELSRLLPRAQTEVVPAAYHLCNLSHPARFNAALTTFLEMHHGH